MNERIKKLAEQAELPLIHNNFLTVSQEKFVELIVRECFELVRFNSNGAGQEILKHFGVEE